MEKILTKIQAEKKQANSNEYPTLVEIEKNIIYLLYQRGACTIQRAPEETKESLTDIWKDFEQQQEGAVVTPDVTHTPVETPQENTPQEEAQESLDDIWKNFEAGNAMPATAKVQIADEAEPEVEELEEVEEMEEIEEPESSEEEQEDAESDEIEELEMDEIEEESQEDDVQQEEPADPMNTMVKQMAERVAMPKEPAPQEPVVETPVTNTPPKIKDIHKADLFNEEHRKPLTDVMMQVSKIMVSSADGNVKDEMTAFIFPLEIRENISNTKILAAVTCNGETMIGSSYDNGEEGNNMVIIQIAGHDLLFQGSMDKYKFQARILPTGFSSKSKETVRELSRQNQNPAPARIGNGHIKFAYDAGADYTGKIEVFPLPEDFLCVNHVDEFTDYSMLKQSGFVVQVADGTLQMVDCSVENGVMEANLVPYEYN